jgi:hypothetical protein
VKRKLSTKFFSILSQQFFFLRQSFLVGNPIKTT